MVVQSQWEGVEGGKRAWQSSGWKVELPSSVEWTVRDYTGWRYPLSHTFTCEKTDGMKPVAGICGGRVGKTVRE